MLGWKKLAQWLALQEDPGPLLTTTVSGSRPPITTHFKGSDVFGGFCRHQTLYLNNKNRCIGGKEEAWFLPIELLSRFFAFWFSVGVGVQGLTVVSIEVSFLDSVISRFPSILTHFSCFRAPWILLTQNGISLVEWYVSGVIAFKLIRIEGVAGCGWMYLTGELEWQPDEEGGAPWRFFPLSMQVLKSLGCGLNKAGSWVGHFYSSEQWLLFWWALMWSSILEPLW